MNLHKLERRIVPCTFRAAEEPESRLIQGHAAVFNRVADLGFFEEEILPGAFDDVLGDDVRALFNHDPNLILGRSVAKTLRLAVDDAGLGYEVDTAPTTYGNDLLISVRRGDVDQSSFAFFVADERWNEDLTRRTIVKFSRLLDVSPVTFPAYTETDASARSADLRAIHQRAMQERQTQKQRLLRRARYWALKGETL